MRLRTETVTMFGLFLFGITSLSLSQTTEVEPLWEWANPLPQGHDLISVATGGGVIVAVGGGGTILVSLDGIGWEVRAATAGYTLNDVAYGNGRFVAVGGKTGFEGSPGLGVYLSSVDGWHWEERHRTDFFTPEAVNWNGLQFIAVGRAGRVLVSPDGETWADHDLMVAEWDMVDLVWGGSRYLAVGHENWFEGRLAQFTSEDGLSWEQAPLDYECVPSALAWAENRYVVVGGVWPGLPCVLTSEDGQDWIRSSLDVTGLLRDVVFADGRFLAVGVRGIVASSTDGYTWFAHENPTDHDLLGMTWMGDRFVAVGEDGVLLSSADGLTWDELSSRQLDFSDLIEIKEVVRGNGVFVGVGSYGVIVTSPDGALWTRQPSGTSSFLRSIVWTGFGFWAVGRETV